MTATTDLANSEVDAGDDAMALANVEHGLTQEGMADPQPTRAPRAVRKVGYAALMALPFALAVIAGYLKYVGSTQNETASAATESVRAANDAAVAMLSYRPDTAQNDLDAAKNRMTGAFRDSYSSLVDDVVAPAAIQKVITAQATVPASASVSATPDHAVVLIFVNQSVTVGTEPPTSTNSSVRVTLDRVDGRWLISGFDPV
jgi:Mce-associated membrane protein